MPFSLFKALSTRSSSPLLPRVISPALIFDLVAHALWDFSLLVGDQETVEGWALPAEVTWLEDEEDVETLGSEGLETEVQVWGEQFEMWGCWDGVVERADAAWRREVNARREVIGWEVEWLG